MLERGEQALGVESLTLDLYPRPETLTRVTEMRVVGGGHEEAPAALDYLEGELPPSGYLFGPLGLADVALASFFVNAGYVGFKVDAGRWPKVARFVGDVLAEPVMAKLLGFEAIQMNASIKGRRQALIDAGVKLSEQSWGEREPRRGVMVL